MSDERKKFWVEVLAPRRQFLYANDIRQAESIARAMFPQSQGHRLFVIEEDRDGVKQQETAP